MASKNSIRDKVAYGVGRLTGKGLSRDHALGIMGALAGESGIGLHTDALNPNDPNGGSIGIGQWHSDRARAMKSYADKRAAAQGLAKGALRKDFKTQMDFAVDEAYSKYSGLMKSISKVSGTPQQIRAEVARQWTRTYENPAAAGRHYTKRAQNAHYYGKLLGDEKVAAIADDKSLTGANLPAETRTDEEIDASMASRPGMPVSENAQAEQARRDEVANQKAIQDTKYAAFAGTPAKEGMLGLQQDNRIQQAMDTMIVDKPAVEKKMDVIDEEAAVDDAAIDDSTVGDEETAAAPEKAKDRSIFGRLSDAVNGIGEELGLTEPDATSSTESKKTGLLDGEVGLGGILGSLAGGLIGGPMGAVAGGMLGQGLFDGLNGTTDETTGEEDGILGGLGRSIDGYLNSIGESLGLGSDSANTKGGGLGPDSGKRDGNFGSFAAASPSIGSRSGGDSSSRRGIGDSDQAGNHDSGTGGSRGRGGGSNSPGGKGGKK